MKSQETLLDYSLLNDCVIGLLSDGLCVRITLVKTGFSGVCFLL